MTVRPQAFSARLALIATAILWGSNHVAARAIHEALPLASLIFWRWGLALAALLPFAVPGLWRHRAVVRAHAGRIAMLGILGVGLFSLFLYAGAYYSLALEVGLLNATTPVWVVVLTALAGAPRVTGRQIVGVFLALAGVVVILMKGSLAGLSGFEFRIGNLWSLLGAMVFAWYTLALGARPVPIPALSLTTLTAGSGFVFVILPVYAGFLLLGGADPLLSLHPPTEVAAATAYIAFGPTLVGNLFWIFGASRLGAARAGPFLYLMPLASLVLSVTLLGEPLALFQLVGAAAIVGGLILSNRGAPPQAVPSS